MAYIYFEKLEVTSSNCERFGGNMDVYNPQGKLAVGKHDVIAKNGNSRQENPPGSVQTYTWCEVKTTGWSYYVILEASKNKFVNGDRVDASAAGKGATVQYQYDENRRAVAQNAANAAENRRQQETAMRDQYLREKEEFEAMEHAAKQDAEAIKMKIDALYTKLSNDMQAMTNTVHQKVEEQKTYADQTANILEQKTVKRIEAVREEAKKQFAKIMKQLNNMRDPVLGILHPVERIAESLFELHRGDGLTAEEYALLELLAQEYDAHALTAYLYAINGKKLLE